jgi:hypothetical protein
MTFVDKQQLEGVDPDPETVESYRKRLEGLLSEL